MDRLSASDSTQADLPEASIRIEVVRKRAGFEALEGPWNDLFTVAALPQHVFQNFNWLWHWANHYLDDSIGLTIIAGWQGDRLVMVWPLVMKGGFPFRRLSWMGEPVSQYGDALVAHSAWRDDWMAQGWKAVMSLGADIAYLRKVRADSNVALLLENRSNAKCFSTGAPYLELSSAPDFETYEKRYPAKLRSSRRRYLRRLQDEGSITFEEATNGPLGRSLSEKAILQKLSWVERHGVIAPNIMDPRFRRFFDDVSSGFDRQVDLRTVAVLCDGEPVGIEISVLCKGHLFGHVIAYSPDFEKKGIGTVLAEFAIKAAHDHGFKVYDLLAPADAYKMQWADGITQVKDWAVPLSPVGSMFANSWMSVVRPYLKASLERTPMAIRLAYIRHVSRRNRGKPVAACHPEAAE